jgi:hypothetical protein
VYMFLIDQSGEQLLHVYALFVYAGIQAWGQEHHRVRTVIKLAISITQANLLQDIVK